MPPPNLASIFAFGIDVLKTTIASTTKAILAQVGDVFSQTVDGDGAEWWQHVGFLSRPPKAVAGSAACQAIGIKGRDRFYIINSRDKRGQGLAGALKDGETCVYAAGEDGTAQARVLLKKDGSIALYTTSDNTSSGESVSLRIAKDGLVFAAPWGTIRFDADGFFVTHSSGASISCGGISGVPDALSSLTSFVTIEAGTVHCAGGLTLLGAGTVHQSCGYGAVDLAPGPVAPAGGSSFSVRCAP